MTDWEIVQGSWDVKPSEFDTEISKVYVYQRRNIERVTNEDGGEFWQYEERKMTRDEYKVAKLESELTQTQLALTELYESILEG